MMVLLKKMGSFMEPGEKIMHGEALLGRPKSAMENKNESGAKSPVNNYEGVNNSYGTFEISGLELEARISKLEKVIAGMKAKHGNRFEEKNH